MSFNTKTFITNQQEFLKEEGQTTPNYFQESQKDFPEESNCPECKCEA
jgi:hypothetical protein